MLKYLLIVSGVIIVTLGFMVYHYKLQADDYRVQIANITAGVDAAAEKQAIKQNQVDGVIITKNVEDAIIDNTKQSEDLNAIQNAPKSDDGPVAPVLTHALDELRTVHASH